MKTIIFYLFFISLLFSCSGNNGKFIIINKSDFNIDSLSIMSDSKKQLITLKRNDQIEHSIKMDEVTTDGSYLISFKNSKNNNTITQGFGYYTNGYQIEEAITITVLNDTILFDSKFNHSY